MLKRMLATLPTPHKRKNIVARKVLRLVYLDGPERIANAYLSSPLLSPRSDIPRYLVNIRLEFVGPPLCETLVPKRRYTTRKHQFVSPLKCRIAFATPDEPFSRREKGALFEIGN